jgi:hypothetical protein
MTVRGTILFCDITLLSPVLGLASGTTVGGYSITLDKVALG